MRLKRLSFCGLTCFRKPAEIDFSAIPSGLVAITGGNGAGKSSTLECSGPAPLYLEFPSRSPSGLTNWVQSGEDKRPPRGGRKVNWIEIEFDMGGRSFWIRHHIGSQATKSVLRIDNGTPTDGKVRSFHAAIAKHIPPKDHFYASNFAMQGGEGRFALLKTGDRRDLFTFYLGLDRINETYERIKTWATGIEFGALERLQQESDELAKEIQGLQTRKVEVAHALADLDQAIHITDEEVSSVRTWERIDDLMDVIADAKATLDRPFIDDARLEELRAQLSDIDDQIRAIHDIGGRLTLAERQLEEAERRASVIQDVPCRGRDDCADCPFLREAKAARGAIPSLEDAVEQLRCRHTSSDVDALEGEKANLQAELASLRGGSTEEDVRIARRRLEDAEAKAKALLKGAGQRPEFDADDLPVLMSRISSMRRQKSELDREEGRLAEKLASLSERASRTRRDLETAKNLEPDIEAASILTRAFSPTGIPALELEAASGRVTDLANDLLRHCYGDRFQVSIRTLAPKKTGGFKEVVELIVRDTERGLEGGIEGFSRGQQVIVDEAIRTALSLLGVERDMRHARVETLWRDETPAALYGENVSRYAAMLKRACKVGGFHHVLAVGDETLARAADAVIEIEDGKVRVR